MSTRRNRNGPVSRLLSPVNATAGFVVRTGSRVLRTTNSVWNKVGNGVRNVFSNATHSLNSAGRRLLTGKRQGGGRRTRKHKKSKKTRRH